MAFTMSPLGRRLALAAAGAAVLAGGAGIAYASSIDDVTETGYATIVEADRSPTDAPGSTAERDCPEPSAGSSADAGETGGEDL